MRILIIEDEPPIAKYISKMCQHVLGDKIKSIEIVHSLEQALHYLSHHLVDMCLLDLNLNGKDGYEILQKTVSQSFHTIVVSSYPDQAIHAFKYGVLDFIQKPFDKERLQLAFSRYFDKNYRNELTMRYLSLRSDNEIKIIAVKDVLYFKGAGNYAEVFLKTGQKELINKPLYRLLQTLPSHFVQIHRSYIIDMNQIKSFRHTGGSDYEVELKNTTCLPLSRHKYKELKNLFNF